MAKTRTKKIITAGSLVIEGVYDRVKASDGPKTREAKHKLSSDAQRRMNAIYSWQKLELILAANFRPGDLVVTLTYDDFHIPMARPQALNKIKYFRKALSEARKAQGNQLLIVWNTENKHGDGRYHHHCVINATGSHDYEQIRAAWGYGTDIEIQPLRVDKGKNYATLARYMTKEEREKPGLRAWSYSRNCKKPEVETFRVKEDTTVQVPKGGTEIETKSEKNQYGSYKVVKYLAPGWDRAPRPSPRRRRKR